MTKTIVATIRMVDPGSFEFDTVELYDDGTVDSSIDLVIDAEQFMKTHSHMEPRERLDALMSTRNIYLYLKKKGVDVSMVYTPTFLDEDEAVHMVKSRALDLSDMDYFTDKKIYLMSLYAVNSIHSETMLPITGYKIRYAEVDK